MFDNADAFNQDISKWDVSSVRRMEFMFRRAYANQDISDWNISAVTTCRMCSRSTSFNQDAIGTHRSYGYG